MSANTLLLEELNKTKEHIIASARKNYSNDGQLAPCALVIDTDGSIHPFIADYKTHDDKQIFIDKIKSICASMNAIAVAFISEAYKKKVTPHELAKFKKGDLENDSEAKEVAIITFETIFNETESITFDMDKQNRQLVNEQRGKLTAGDFTGVLSFTVKF